MNDSSEKRIFGLDLLRSIAVILVVIGHSNYLIDKFTHFPFIPLPEGVNLFFVLSGYLVGTIIIKLTNQYQRFNLSITLNFLQRRWFRTIPNYFLFLLLNIILIYFGLIKGSLNKYLITYFLFFQNFHKPYDFLFWESWSLSVQVWFYFSLPLILLLLFKFTNMKAKNILFSAIIIFLLFPLAYRIFQSNHHSDFDLYFRKLVLTRLDTVGFGLLAAYVHWYHSIFWHKTKNILFVLGLTLITLLAMFDFQSMFFLETFYYCFIGLSIFFILPKLESLKKETIPLKPFQFISKISYSLYLLHIPLLQIISKIFTVSNKYESLLLYGFFWLTAIIMSHFVFVLYEKPLMNIRENIHIKIRLKN